jgi:hypothetical protein
MPKKVTWKPVVWRSGLPRYCRTLEFDQKIRDFALRYDALCHVVSMKPPDTQCEVWKKYPKC